MFVTLTRITYAASTMNADTIGTATAAGQTGFRQSFLGIVRHPFDVEDAIVNDVLLANFTQGLLKAVA